MNQWIKNIIAFIFGLLIALLSAEIIVRITGIYEVYSERRFGRFIDLNQYNRKNVYWNYPAHGTHKLESPEFEFSRKSNNYGFSDKDFEKRTDTSEIRILCLGDSFTEGDGAPADSSYPAQLNFILNDRFPDKKIRVFNAGICGSDPVFGFRVYAGLREIIDPDIIIQSLSAQDIMEDITARGGFERFVNDSTIQFIPLKWNWLYKRLHLSRIYFKEFCGYNDFFVNEQVREERKPALINTMRQMMKLWNDTLQPRQKIYFLLRPDQQEIKDKVYNKYFQSILDSIMPISGSVVFIDYKEWLTDVYQIPQEEIQNIFWEHDGHHNSRGYNLMAQCVADKLIPLIEKDDFFRGKGKQVADTLHLSLNGSHPK